MKGYKLVWSIYTRNNLSNVSICQLLIDAGQFLNRRVRACSFFTKSFQHVTLASNWARLADVGPPLHKCVFRLLRSDVIGDTACDATPSTSLPVTTLPHHI